MQKTIRLNSGYDIPVLGLGTWKSEPNKVGEAIKYALTEAGYKHIDGAMIYRNESEIGTVYKEVFKTIKREEIFITSKLWNTNHDPKFVEAACRQTLADLQLDYLDLYLMHWGVAFKHGDELEPMKDGQAVTENVSIRETWEAMEKLVDLGLVRSIGVANFTAMMLHDLTTYATIVPAMNQIELHPYNSQQSLVDYCHSLGIAVTAYSPTGRMGVDLDNVTRLHEDPIVKKVAAKRGKSIPQILINWAIERGTIVIPKSVTPARIKENIEIFDFQLDKADMMELNSLDKGLRYVDPSEWWGIPYFK
jgi:diketogulonate reductase-like aldo/keto reductase